MPLPQQKLPETQERSVTKEWLKVLTKALSYAGISGKKSPWEMADLAYRIETKWGEHPKYNLAGLSAVTGISEKRLHLLAKAAAFFPPGQRFTELSISHHVEVMKAAPNQAIFWLKEAREKRWSSKDIRLAIAGDGDPRRYSWLRCGTFWYFTACDSRFGINYPGRIPGQIPANTIHYFTEPGDLVVDLMAGGGSTLDAATFLGRRCLAYDLMPARTDIKQHNALLGLPEEVKKVKLFFLDPPYGSICRGFYKDHPNCLSRMSKDDFLKSLRQIVLECRKAILPDGRLALLIQNVFDWEGDTVFQVLDFLLQDGWELDRRIQVPLPTQQISSAVMRWARDNRQMVNIDRDLLILRSN
ncbi:site-specific DNA-methyltransferase [Leptolyngbya sp. DQ-M1]|uniref:DNA methyltransferase n=1 Tax=Leptolyngbya sp. DQ-M1 TaxID=2933920 RepID=UPI003299F633